ncbi:uncharacterized protein I206_100688 [Kwoniella pini CBS 10737]|uniref:peptidylprolyl isomerase n=1 Tax=Kwoniella pini CBS 10737 TaxID=1296096 RepID=A0AAJ8KZW1_9TREE
MPNPRTFFDFSVGDKSLGRVVFELYKDVVPKTVENFRALCTGEKGISKISNIPLHYKGCPIHRVIDGFMIQGGDFTKRNGSGGESIYEGPFEDERLEGEGTEVDKKGLLVMANRGPNTNGSQFFITLAPSPHLTGKHVVFGKVIFGLEHIEAIGKLSTDDRDRPLTPVVISHCGELELKRPPPKQIRSPSVSSSRSRSVSPDRRRRKSKSKSRRDDSEDEVSDDSLEKERRKSKKKKDRKDRDRKDRDRKKEKKPREETEEELDMRLEREEKERLEKERLTRLEEMKKQIELERQKIKDEGGVVYKGRGSMRYLDPETTHRSMPRNFDSRATDSRPRAPRGPPPHLSDRISNPRDRRDDRGFDRGDRRENTQRDRLDRDMDKWQHDRSQAQSIGDRERAKFRRGRSRSRSRSPVNNGNERSISPRPSSVIPTRMRSRSKSIGARSDNSDMVLDLDD